MEWPKQPVTQDHFYSINAAQNDDILCNNTIPLIFVFGIVSALPLANRSSSHCYQRLFRHCNFVFDICTAGGRCCGKYHDNKDSSHITCILKFDLIILIHGKVIFDILESQALRICVFVYLCLCVFENFTKMDLY